MGKISRVLVAFFMISSYTFASESPTDSESDDLNVQESLTTADNNVRLRVSPMGLLLRRITLDLDFVVAPHWTVGPSLYYMSISNTYPNMEGTWFGVRSNYLFSGNLDKAGWYVSANLQYVSITIRDNDYNRALTLKRKVTGASLTGIGGYQWVWDFLTLGFGAGASVYTFSNSVRFDEVTPAKESKDFFAGGIQPYLELDLGILF